MVTRKKWGIWTGGEVLTTQIEKGKNRCIYRGLIRGPTGFVPNLEVVGLLEETD